MIPHMCAVDFEQNHPKNYVKTHHDHQALPLYEVTYKMGVPPTKYQAACQTFSSRSAVKREEEREGREGEGRAEEKKKGERQMAGATSAKKANRGSKKQIRGWLCGSSSLNVLAGRCVSVRIPEESVSAQIQPTPITLFSARFITT